MQASLHAAFRDGNAFEGDELSQTELLASQGPSRTVLDDPVNQDNRQLFFAKVLRSATEEEVRRLFGQFGKVTDVNLFRAFQGAPTTKGCGLVTMGTHNEAVSAIAALDNQYVWEGMETPMVVKWMDMALQRRRREQHLANMRQAMAGGAGLGFVPGGLALATSLPVVAGPSLSLMQTSFLDALEPAENPPPGCSPDAIKLFVGNVPKSCTDEQLLPLFQSIGKVVELVIVHDKVTHESKGSAFVWYASRADAERAILQFNFRHVLPDPSGDQDRPLVVRRAKTRAKPLKTGSLLGGLGAVGGPGIGGMAGVGSAAPFFKMQNAAGMVGLAGLDTLQLGDGGAANAAALAQAYGGGGLQQPGLQGGLGVGVGAGPGAAGLTMPPYRPMGLGLSAVAGAGGAGLYDAYPGGSDQLFGDLGLGGGGGGSHSGGLDVLGGLQQPGGGAGGGVAQPLAQSMTLNQNQLAVLNTHLFSVQTVSGAQLHISPGAPGLFNLVVSGNKAQVETAKGLIQTVLSHA
ncbi:hypothetical protein HYH02_000960 [Chlamydomonas schloesseri]|uniref:RRM domain-containing protein n=1 Tax=Chlamydomonas schloesseri TaxID=2026947 RepID=A0A835WWT4_9CHLO|nr:hypothetical protein HYH02_000960 [Chlamydomonas schloesseri]|eukprot:KAG2455141.1 hypothetical protein HYH02_000960 [Chlamydomonas schloesseri]